MEQQTLSLKELLAQPRVLAPCDAATIVHEACASLKGAHALGRAYGGISLARIQVACDRAVNGSVKFAALGERQAWPPDAEGEACSSEEYTARYMSPEQVRGENATPASDLYALGVVMYEAVTGRAPFVGGSAERTKQRHLLEMPIPPQQLSPAVDDDFNDIVCKALEKDPARRYQSADELADVLQAYLANPVHAHRNVGYPSEWFVDFVQAPDSLRNTAVRFAWPCIVGRGSASQIRIPEGSVSRKHAQLTPRGMFVEVEDLFSSNGTIVDGVKLPAGESVLCSAGTTITLGNVQITLQTTATLVR